MNMETFFFCCPLVIVIVTTAVTQDFLVVFAAGNCGDTSATDDFIDNCDVLDDDQGTVLSPAQAKNVVAVGSSESAGMTNKDEDTVSYFSSKGPTIDGRIKPDVVAPGDPTWSAYADPTGTSCEFDYQTVSRSACVCVRACGYFFYAPACLRGLALGRVLVLSSARGRTICLNLCPWGCLSCSAWVGKDS